MTINVKIVSVVLVAALGVSVADADAQDASAVLQNQGCRQCHLPDHQRGRGPDLGDRLVVDYTIPALAADIWNHTPAMWAEMSAQATKQPTPSEADWEAVFRYLYTMQFIDRPGFAREGVRVFGSRCTTCHGVGINNPGPGKPVAEWAPLDRPLALVYRMWTHAASMKDAFASGDSWKALGAQEFVNLTAYVQAVQKVQQTPQVALSVPAQGRFLTLQHCGGCHGGSDSFAASLAHNRTLMDIGAAMWNHVPLVESVPVLSPEDFEAIVAYVWELQYRGPAGDVRRGETVFEEKGCLSCHRVPSGVREPLSPRPGKTFTPLSMVALGWGSGREMHRQMQEKGVLWPRLSPQDMSDLVAYLNTLH